MMKNYFARPNQNLNDHLRDVAHYMKNSIRHENETYVLAGLLHDIGKFSEKFQNRIINSESNYYRHPIAALPLVDFILKKINVSDKDRSLISFAIYFHHNLISFDQLQNDIISIKTDYKNSKENFTLNEDEVKAVFYNLNDLLKEFNYNVTLSFDDFDSYLKSLSENSKNDQYFELYLSRLDDILRDFYNEYMEIDEEKKNEFSKIYSLLVEADWLSINGNNRKNSFNELNEIMMQKYNELNSKNPENHYRISVKDTVLNSSENRLFLIAPTGIGKSEISLLWALKKAKETNAERIIYVLPFNALIDDLYNRFSSYLNKNVSFWNSEYIYDKYFDYSVDNKDSFPLNSFEDFTFYRLEREYFFNSPIIITTADQILNSFLNLKRYPIRRGIFEKSIFVFDEIQGYDNKIRILLYNFINSLSSDVPVLLMTATPPFDVQLNNLKLNTSINLLNHTNKELNFTILYDKTWFDFHKAFDCKVNIESVDGKDFKAVIPKIKELVNSAISKHNSIAIIVNKVHDAVDLYKGLDHDNKILLHSKMLKKDKEERFRKIYEYLANNKEFILVSTQVIEAGVDISFDYMIRLVAPIPSIIQSLGRVNRRGKQPNSEFVLLLLDKDNKDNKDNNESKSDNQEDNNDEKESKKNDKNKSKNNKNSSSNSKNKNDSDSKYYPYFPDEIKFVTKFITEKKDMLSSKMKYEEIFLNEKTFNDFSIERWKEAILSYSYISGIVQKTIWSVEKISEILGEDLRDSAGQIRIFVEDQNKKSSVSDKDFINKLKNLRGEDFKNHFKDYIEFLRSSNNYIVDYPRIKLSDGNKISLEKYKEKYLGEE